MAYRKVFIDELLRDAGRLGNSSNTRSRIHLYTTMKKSVRENKISSVEAQRILDAAGFSIILGDIAAVCTDDTSLDLKALEFLGSLIERLPLPLQQQLDVISCLCGKVTIPQDQELSRQVLWCLGKMTLDDNLPDDSLDTILTTTVGFLVEVNGSLPRISIVHEAIQILHKLSVQKKPFCLLRLHLILTCVSPYLFCNGNVIRELALETLNHFLDEISSGQLLDETLQIQFINKFRDKMIRLVWDKWADALKVWSFIVKAMGASLHSNSLMLKTLLLVHREALEKPNPAHTFRQKEEAAFRLLALTQWRTLIECFALDLDFLSQTDQIAVVLGPLSAPKLEAMTYTIFQIELWHLLAEKLGPDAVNRTNDVILPLLVFCFGSSDQQTSGRVGEYDNLMPLAAYILCSILSEELQFEMKDSITGVVITRSHLLLRQEDFLKSANNLSQYVLQVVKVLPANSQRLSVLRFFLRRFKSSDELEMIKPFFTSLFELPSEVTGCLLDMLKEDFEDIREKVTKWYTEHQSSRDHHLDSPPVPLPDSTSTAALPASSLE